MYVRTCICTCTCIFTSNLLNGSFSRCLGEALGVVDPATAIDCHTYVPIGSDVQHPPHQTQGLQHDIHVYSVDYRVYPFSDKDHLHTCMYTYMYVHVRMLFYATA